MEGSTHHNPWVYKRLLPGEESVGLQTSHSEDQPAAGQMITETNRGEVIESVPATTKEDTSSGIPRCPDPRGDDPANPVNQLTPS